MKSKLNEGQSLGSGGAEGERVEEQARGGGCVHIVFFLALGLR